MKSYSIKKIVAGGQTGVDRAALEAAIVFNIPHGGWCPRGRKAEDGTISSRYQLQETESEKYEQRTTWNVRDSDATLIILQGEPTGGTLFTIEKAKELKKPFFIFDLAEKKEIEPIVRWIEKNNIETLNVAGPRASQDRDIYRLAYELLSQFL